MGDTIKCYGHEFHKESWGVLVKKWIFSGFEYYKIKRHATSIWTRVNKQTQGPTMRLIFKISSTWLTKLQRIRNRPVRFTRLLWVRHTKPGFAHWLGVITNHCNIVLVYRKLFVFKKYCQQNEMLIFLEPINDVLGVVLIIMVVNITTIMWIYHKRQQQHNVQGRVGPDCFSVLNWTLQLVA